MKTFIKGTLKGSINTSEATEMLNHSSTEATKHNLTSLEMEKTSKINELKMMKYYITHPSNKQSILTNGIKSDEDGEILLFDNQSIEVYHVINYVADYIAHTQLFLKKFIMFEIDEQGINEIEQDESAEFSACYQYIVHQDLIEPQFIKLFGEFTTEFTSFYSIDNLMENRKDENGDYQTKL